MVRGSGLAESRPVRVQMGEDIGSSLRRGLPAPVHREETHSAEATADRGCRLSALRGPVAAGSVGR